MRLDHLQAGTFNVERDVDDEFRVTALDAAGVRVWAGGGNLLDAAAAADLGRRLNAIPQHQLNGSDAIGAVNLVLIDVW